MLYEDGVMTARKWGGGDRIKCLKRERSVNRGGGQKS